MNTKYINFVLITVIVMVAGGMGFFGWRAWSGRSDAQKQALTQEPRKEFVPFIVENKGKESEEHDAAMERDVRIINDAVLAYAKDHKGKYPESDFKNPCSGVQYCMKGTDINTTTKRYLEKIPQVEPFLADYHYRADNTKGSFCVKIPGVLVTENTSVFQCAKQGCGRVLFGERCD